MCLRFSLCTLTLGCGLATFAQSAPRPTPSRNVAPALSWDAAFRDLSGPRPVHFVAQYTDARGSHRLEEWRSGSTHLRRLTDDRIDLHADAISNHAAGTSPATQPPDYLWQVIDLRQHILNRISSQGMLNAGLTYSFYSMAHVLTHPAGRFTLTAASQAVGPALHLAGASCTWFELTPADQAPSRICWSPQLAVPLRIDTRLPSGVWSPAFTLRSFDRNPLPAATFRVDPAHLQVRDHDELTRED